MNVCSMYIPVYRKNCEIVSNRSRSGWNLNHWKVKSGQKINIDWLSMFFGHHMEN